MLGLGQIERIEPGRRHVIMRGLRTAWKRKTRK